MLYSYVAIEMAGEDRTKKFIDVRWRGSTKSCRVLGEEEAVEGVGGCSRGLVRLHMVASMRNGVSSQQFGLCHGRLRRISQ